MASSPGNAQAFNMDIYLAIDSVSWTSKRLVAGELAQGEKILAVPDWQPQFDPWNPCKGGKRERIPF